ncbi:Holliday junction branch migration protein RuvA [Mycoplasma sp. ATU-Cv-703]|uniref:Holliday junction branch migration protein RuvA n=1 Tax=Mycoplasma sp. ATU-Cv-703 TaxID=2498595 RepID=UPI000FDF4FB1
MEIYRIGKVVAVGNLHIVLESRYSGEIIYVADGSKFTRHKIQKVYIYRCRNDYQDTLYGFSDFRERSLFEDLIAISGIGPKSALNLLRSGVEWLVKCIVEDRLSLLVEKPGIGIKTARQIILGLRDKYANFGQKKSVFTEVSKLKAALLSLGFNQSQIDKASEKVEKSDSLDKMVESAIKIIAREKFA